MEITQVSQVEMDCAPNKVYSACDQVRKHVGKASRVIFYYNGHGAMSCSHVSSERGRCIWVVNGTIMHYTGPIILLICTLVSLIGQIAIFGHSKKPSCLIDF